MTARREECEESSVRSIFDPAGRLSVGRSFTGQLRSRIFVSLETAECRQVVHGLLAKAIETRVPAGRLNNDHFNRPAGTCHGVAFLTGRERPA